MSALGKMAAWPVGRAAAAVVGPGGVLETYGEQGEVFYLASVTKPLVALSVLVAAEEGALGLDDPAGPDGSTVRHLLSHASGLAFDQNIAVAKPGTRRVYSNAGFDVLGAHLTKATGISCADYLRQALCEPLELTATELVGPPHAGGQSTIGDLTRVAAELLSPGRLIHPSTLAALATVQFPGLSGVVPGFGRQSTNDWGLGFEIRDSKTPHWTGAGNHPATFGHFGRAGTFLWVDPVARLSLIVLTDTEFEQWAKDAWPPLADAVLAEYGSGQKSR